MDEAKSSSEQDVTLNKLAQDFKLVVHDAESLLKATAGDVGDRVREARQRLSGSLESAKASYQKVQDQALEGAKAADKVIRQHPYESLGVAFGVGLLVGVLLGRR